MKLKPCPFCGGDAERDVYVESTHNRESILYCLIQCKTGNDCSVSPSTRAYVSMIESAKRWNKRHNEK